VDSFISQFPRLVTVFKFYKVYWSNDQKGVYHEMKSLTMIVSHSFQDIRNELDNFYPHETSFNSFFINTVTCHHQIWCGKLINVIKPLMKPPVWMGLHTTECHNLYYSLITPLNGLLTQINGRNWLTLVLHPCSLQHYCADNTIGRPWHLSPPTEQARPQAWSQGTTSGSQVQVPSWHPPLSDQPTGPVVPAGLEPVNDVE
jgi:hypothetical protein